jgi:hypothetical protein
MRCWYVSSGAMYGIAFIAHENSRCFRAESELIQTLGGADAAYSITIATPMTDAIVTRNRGCMTILPMFGMV